MCLMRATRCIVVVPNRTPQPSFTMTTTERGHECNEKRVVNEYCRIWRERADGTAADETGARRGTHCDGGHSPSSGVPVPSRTPACDGGRYLRSRIGGCSGCQTGCRALDARRPV